MPADYTALQAAITDAVAQATINTTLEGSATVLLNSQADAILKAVTAALEADNAADQGTIDAVTKVIKDTNAQYVASAGPLGEAVAAGTPPVSARRK